MSRLWLPPGLTLNKGQSLLKTGLENRPKFAGGTESASAGYRYHAFTAGGTITMVRPGLVDILLVGAGGTGARHSSAGASGGGAGGVMSLLNVYLNATGTIVIGTATGGSITDATRGADGGSTFITWGTHCLIAGGGGGGVAGQLATDQDMLNKVGSGAGAYGGTTAQGNTAGTTVLSGLTTVGIYANNGGTSFPSGTSANRAGGGGGGAGAAGSNASSAVGGAGGAGIDLSAIWGTTWGVSGVFGGGGGGGANGGTYGAGGSGGGGAASSTTGTAGTANTGGGGGAGDSGVGGTGGSGLLVVRYRDPSI
jgi:hypothetical protein